MKKILSSISDGKRFEIVKLLLKGNYCVRALAQKLSISESAVSQHIKNLKGANLVAGKKKGYFMHYEVKKKTLLKLPKDIEKFANIERTPCKLPDEENCPSDMGCHTKKNIECSKEVQEACHGKQNDILPTNHQCRCNKDS